MTKGMAATDPETRARVTAAGGRARAEAMTAEQRASVAGAAGAAGHRPVALARRIVKAWPNLTEAERDELRGVLAVVWEESPEMEPSPLGGHQATLSIRA